MCSSDLLVAMNRPSLEKFAGEVKPGGLLLYNAAIGAFQAPAGVRALAVPALELATEGGSPRASNTVMVGVMAALGGLGLGDEAYRQAIASNFAGKEKVVRQNEAVFDLARRWGAGQRV